MEVNPRQCRRRNDTRRNAMLLNAIARFRALIRDDDGQDLIEYALIGSLIAIVAIATIGDAGTEVGRLWTNIANGIKKVP